jgi:hypothetical protein
MTINTPGNCDNCAAIITRMWIQDGYSEASVSWVHTNRKTKGQRFIDPDKGCPECGEPFTSEDSK